MTDQTFDEAQTNEAAMAEQFARLKERAKLMGLTFSPNIGMQTLADKVAEKLAEDAGDGSDAEEEVLTSTMPEDVVADPYLESHRLIRCRIQCVNPNKQALAGEVHTIGNSLGSIKKYVPYGEGSEEGWHLPKMLFDHLKEKVYLQTKTVKLPNGRETVRNSWVREFVIDVLEPLTEAELQRLAVAQMAEGIVETQDAISV